MRLLSFRTNIWSKHTYGWKYHYLNENETIARSDNLVVIYRAYIYSLLVELLEIIRCYIMTICVDNRTDMHVTQGHTQHKSVFIMIKPGYAVNVYHITNVVRVVPSDASEPHIVKILSNILLIAAIFSRKFCHFKWIMSCAMLLSSMHESEFTYSKTIEHLTTRVKNR